MERRSFIKWTGIAALTAALSKVLSSCGGQVQSGSSTPPSAAVSESEFIDLGGMDELAETGSLRYQTPSGNSILVVQSSNDAQSVHAFSSVCTHRGCNVTWKTHDQVIGCACHGSNFSAEGDVLQGPAQQPLQQYIVKVEEERILIERSSVV